MDTQSALGAISLAINDAGTELHAAWSSKNSTYPNSFNIRYAKGTIAADGSVTWGAVEQSTTFNNSSLNSSNPSVTLDKNGVPCIIHQVVNDNSTARSIDILKNANFSNFPVSGGNWRVNTIYYIGSAHNQFSPASFFVPQSINGLANGRLWVAWHGKDATDSAKFNIRTSFSDDGGVTWATPTKQTTGNLYDQTNASLTADAQGKVLLTWDAQNATTTQTALKVFSSGTWGATTTLTGDGYTNATTLFDNTFKLSMTTPLLIRQSTSGVYFSGNYFTGASITPASGALGDKTASSVLSYTVTPESGSTITSIVEKVNGATVNTYSNPASLSRTFTIPAANWDALKYYNTHTISVTVTDSNGMANTQTYTFNKALANDASLLEGAKAAKDGKDRISTKRDGIAGQVGLPPGSTFDAISAAIDSRNVVKRQSGIATASGGQIVVNTLLFMPKAITLKASTGSTGVYNESIGLNETRSGTTPNPNAFTNITATSFTAGIGGTTTGTTVTWEVFG
ncbi:hypothetical protein [Exiguobacterium sp. S22-S28]|uniref:hypothetical protein n=1 Tax=Exiguobacterium sp. S22-S28 TaxID=3342768 RepID=UPI00372CE8A3